MKFHSPHVLWALVPIAVLLVWEVARRAAHASAVWPKIARAWAGASEVTPGAAHTTADDRPRIWLWLGLALCLVALARPQWGTVEEPVFDQSREVLIAVDLSKSMLAQDVKPSRLDRAKLLIQSLLDKLQGERVGLVLFSGTAFLQSPLSADYEILREFLPALNPGYLPAGGSNYRAMLETSIQAFGTSTADRYLIILSDGESTEESWKELAPRLREKDIRVVGLGIGTAAGAFIPDEAGGFVKDERGAVVLSRLNSSTLQELAQLSGGVYSDASAWVDLPALLKKTVAAGRKGEFRDKNSVRLVERFQWFLAPGLLLLFISFWVEFPVRPRERALPLRGTAGARKLPGKAARTGAASAAFAIVALTAPHETRSEDATAKPLATLVGRLSSQPILSAKDCAEMAETTITYGQRMQSAQQAPAEGAIRDALAAVDAGEARDSHAADWKKLRKDLQDLLKKNQPPPPRDQQKQDQQKKENDKDDQRQQQQQQQQEQKSQQQDQQQDQNPNPQQQQGQQQPGSDQDNKDGGEKNKPPQNTQSAFGDMDENKPQKPPQPKPSGGTQTVGGQREEKSAEPANPELAMPLQKLDQVRGQDSPARLFQLMEGKQQAPARTGKDW